MAIADPTRAALAELQRELRALPGSAARKLRPVRPENLHVTVKFLGATPDTQVGDVVEALTAVAARTTRPDAAVEGVGAFPSAERPRVLFAALGDGREAVAALCADVQRALEPLGFAAEGRAPHPHVTLARVQAAKPRGALTIWLDRTAARAYGPVASEALILFESHLTASGAVYRPLASVPLGDP